MVIPSMQSWIMLGIQQAYNCNNEKKKTNKVNEISAFVEFTESHENSHYDSNHTECKNNCKESNED